jgi:hypothetical protein
MSQRKPITEDHRLDDQGRPAGGCTTGYQFVITWQDGPTRQADGSYERNGAFVEEVLEACIGRVEFYNTTEFKCRENSLAITHMEEALHWLQARTADREKRGVEGTHAL